MRIPPFLTAIALSVTAFFGGFLQEASAVVSPGVMEQGEYVIVSGGPALRKWENLRHEPLRHDKWWGNFIRTARIRVEQLRKTYGDKAKITWLVYRPAYEKRMSEDGKPLIDNVKSVRDKFGVRLVWFDSGDDVVSYLNSGKNRRKTKLTGFEYFGHSNRHCFMFDYSCDILAVSSAYLHENDLKKVKRGIFAPGAHIQSYGCHTAEAMAKKWKAATGTTMIGAMGKTDYSRSWEGKLPHINRGHWRR
jgi:hypothetical protein